MSITSRNVVSRFLSPGVFFLGGFILLISGIGINYFFGLKGQLQLEVGKKNNLSTSNLSSQDSSQKNENLGIVITLDSLKIRPYTPEYQIKLLKRDTISVHTDYQAGATFSVVNVFPLEQMKIREVEKTDLRFRLKKFYPNFEFAYTYPSERDTIEPRAPGITLELKTKEGTPIVTLLSNQVGKQRLGDIVSLGASLAFYWEIAEDSVKAIADDQEKSGNMIVFSGANKKLFFILNGMLEEKPFKEKTFYNMPGQDSVGFTILYCFPDAAYLKAVPSTKGTELLNPVANVEIWKLGEGYRDAFVYPETRIRKGGDFMIPESDYKIGLGINPDQSKRYCDCSVSIQKDSTQAPESLVFISGKSRTYHGYRFTPVECRSGFPPIVTMQVAQNPGRILIILGLLLAGVAIFLHFLNGKKQPA